MQTEDQIFRTRRKFAPPVDCNAVSCSRCQLLLQAYKTTIDEDTALLSGGGAKQLSQCSTAAIKIRLSEKKVLHNAVLFARTLKESLLNQPIEEEEEYGINGSGAHDETQPTGNLGGAANNYPVILEIDSEGGIREATQPTGNMAGAADNVPVAVEVGSEVSSDQHGDESDHDLQQTTGNLVGAASNVPVVAESKSDEALSKTGGLIKPGEDIKSEQVNGEIDNDEPQELCSDESKEKSEEGERERMASEEEERRRRERDENDEVVRVKGGDGGKVEGQGGGCHDDEGGGVSEKTDLEQTNQCINGKE